MFKKIISILLTVVLSLSFAVTALTNDRGAERINAVAIKDNIEIPLTAYDISGYKCVRIDDLAMLLEGTSRSFNPVYTDNEVIINTHTAYKGNYSPLTADMPKYPAYTTKPLNINVNGNKTAINSYLISGYTYVTLKSLSPYLGYGLLWNADNFTITLTEGSDSSKTLLTVIMALTPDIDPNKPMIALTFDDGPRLGSTEIILDALDSVNGHATFFMVGSRVEQYPDLVNKVHKQGSQIGNHTYSHANLGTLTPEQVKQEINKTSNAVYDAAGVYPHIGRPPYGSINDVVTSASSIEWFNWSVDTLDWKYLDAEYVYNYVISHAQDGAVILLHDLHPTTAQAMIKAIPKLTEMGYQLVTIDQMAQYKGGAQNVRGYIKK